MNRIPFPAIFFSYCLLLACLTACGAEPAAAPRSVTKADSQYPEVAAKLTPLATPIPKPAANDWLANHKEAGQSFEQYLAARPIRRSDKLTTIYICLIGEFTPKQREVLTATEKYLSILYDAPVKIRKTITLDDIPPRAQRKHPTQGQQQILSTYVLSDVLAKDRPADALAYLAFTATDLYPQDDWNFVFGQASLRERTGVWSINRNGNPADSDDAFRLCLRRTLKTAGHETGHILTIQHCIAFHCGMNGSNHRDESDSQPLTFCPVCYRKVCWNLQVDPKAHLKRLADFCDEHKLTEEAAAFAKYRKAFE
jgi:archaemetzincin